ncbi:ABC transporter ATP-binding protein [Aliidongia dinghuensis]|uniref:ABC transporter ATP-binding protein n=1 Tax=Aliidongia dinghuensis TaxID=1867774 RepID=A0A8J3E3D5_9PROT|nr:ABC transporter ATP-binding protein [Aliidongia dinghuensis]GGF05729.1 ABC transporter ATP-binding protein [Aliidongia dinghuensis]
MSEPLVEIRDLSVHFRTDRGTAEALRHVSLDLGRGRAIGVVGESGSGKSTLAAALMRLLAANLARLDGSIRFEGRDLLALPLAETMALRGTRFAMVFQDPMTALNPVFTVGSQLVEFQRARRPFAPSAELRERALAMLAHVGIADPARRFHDYPHEFSGGMRQRVMIAAALLTEADLLIADEPTTALDPTIEAQIVALMRHVHAETGNTLMLISHDLGLISQLCDDVVVLYAGTVVETGPMAEVFRRPLHPYTRALVACEIGDDKQHGDLLASIPGETPDLSRVPAGCIFADRCPDAVAACRDRVPDLRAFGPERRAACSRL